VVAGSPGVLSGAVFELKFRDEPRATHRGNFKSAVLEHDPEKWKPVSGKIMLKTKNARP
jgi:hypothetical protein